MTMSVVIRNNVAVVEMDKRKYTTHKVSKWIRLDDDVLEKVNIKCRLSHKTPEEVVNDVLWDNLSKLEDVPNEFDAEEIWNKLDHDKPEGDDILDRITDMFE